MSLQNAIPRAASTRLSRFSAATREVTDAWQHSQSATHWSHLFEQVHTGQFTGHTSEVWLGPVQVIYERVHQAFSYRGRPWKGSRLFQVSLPIGGEIYYDGRPMPSNVLTTRRWDSGDRVLGNGSAECVIVAVDEVFFTHHVERVLGYPAFENARHTLVLSTDPSIVDRFRKCALSLLREAHRPRDVLLDDQSRVSLQNYLVAMLLDILAPQLHAVERLPRPSTRAYIVEKAAEFIEERLSQPVTLSDICLALRVSPRTLRYSFADIVGISPMRYLLVRRLNGARRDLMQRGSMGTVEEVALRWGFQHMGRFAISYRSVFGECPSTTSSGVCTRSRRFKWN